jgi:DNA-binding MarR family transcriptional regulator
MSALKDLKKQPSVGFLLHDAARLLRRRFNRRVSQLGLTQAQWQLLAYLSRQEGLRQAQIADYLEMQPISVARLVDRMETNGWIERRPDPEDRRAVNLYITAKAEPILEKMWEHAAVSRTEAFAGISKADQDKLFDILSRMRENLCGPCPYKDGPYKDEKSKDEKK